MACPKNLMNKCSIVESSAKFVYRVRHMSEYAEKRVNGSKLSGCETGIFYVTMAIYEVYGWIYEISQRKSR